MKHDVLRPPGGTSIPPGTRGSRERVRAPSQRVSITHEQVARGSGRVPRALCAAVAPREKELQPCSQCEVGELPTTSRTPLLVEVRITRREFGVEALCPNHCVDIAPRFARFDQGHSLCDNSVSVSGATPHARALTFVCNAGQSSGPSATRSILVPDSALPCIVPDIRAHCTQYTGTSFAKYTLAKLPVSYRLAAAALLEACVPPRLDKATGRRRPNTQTTTIKQEVLCLSTPRACAPPPPTPHTILPR